MAAVDLPAIIEVSADCLGTAQCVMTAPDLFRLTDDEQSQPRREIRNRGDLELAQTAARSCPTQAISIVPGT